MRNRGLWRPAIFSLAFLLLLPAVVSANGRGHFGGFHTVVVPGYWGYGWGWGYPYWGDPYWGYGPYYPADTRGQIKIKDADKNDQVYINGAFAGTVEKMRSIKLNPGTYDIRIDRDGRKLVDRNVYVVSGKEVEIHVNNG